MSFPQPYFSGQSLMTQSQLTGFLPHDSLQVQDADPNSPDVFRRNVSLVLAETQKLQVLARTVLSRIQSAYQPGIAPYHTQANIGQLHGQLALVLQMLCQSGVGALPVLPLPEPAVGTSIPAMPNIPKEEELLASTMKSLKTLYDKVQKSQDSAAVVGNLVGFEKEKDGSILPGSGSNDVAKRS